MRLQNDQFSKNSKEFFEGVYDSNALDTQGNVVI